MFLIFRVIYKERIMQTIKINDDVKVEVLDHDEANRTHKLKDVIVDMSGMVMDSIKHI